MKTKKILSIIIAVIMILSSATVVFAGNGEGNIIILYTNDVHCAIDDYAFLAAYRAEKIAEGNTVITVDAGDAIQGEVIGTLTKGEAVVDIMNTVGYDYAVPGNHEFDYNMETFLDIAENKSSYEYISSNFYSLTSVESVLEPYAIKDTGDVQIAFVGISTPETVSKANPDYFKGEGGNFIYGFPTYDMEDGVLYETVQKSVDEAIEDGADIVVAVGHLGILETTDGWKSTDVIANTNGIDYFIDAHSHETIESAVYKNKDDENVILTSTGTKFANFGQLTISADGTADFELINPDDIDVETMSADAEKAYNTVKDKIDGYRDEIAYLYEVIGTSDVNLIAYEKDGSWAVRKRETNAGDFVADAYRAVTGADIALCNGGGIRNEIATGDVTRKMLMDMNPWSNSMCVIEITGQQLLDILEHGARSCPEPLGGFFQVSGVTYEINAFRKSPVITDMNGNFIGIDETKERRVGNVLVNGKPVDIGGKYTVAGTEYVLTSGGDGLTMLEGAKVIEQEGLLCDSEMLIKYFTENLGGKITADKYGKSDGDGRIVINTDCEHNFDRTKSEENLTRPANGNDGYYTYTCTNGCGKTETEVVKRADYTEYSAAHERFGETIKKYDFNEIAINYATEKHAEMLEKYLSGSWLKNNYIESEQYILDGLADGFNELCDELLAGAEDGTFLNADYTEIDKEIAALEEWDVDGAYEEIIDNIKAELEELKADDTSTQADVYELLARIDAIRNCEHICHSGNWFLKILWSIANFFCRLFKIVPTCVCGMAHY